VEENIMVKCSKCGADIPDAAAFCPGCGTPKSAEQPAPQATQAQTSQPSAQPAPQPRKSEGSGLQGLIDTLFSKLMIILGLFIGILVAWICRVIAQFVTWGIGNQVLNLLNFTFMAGVGLLLLGGGLFNKNFDKYIRVGLIVAGGLILAANL
jgi:hypothetical protein